MRREREPVSDIRRSIDDFTTGDGVFDFSLQRHAFKRCVAAFGAEFIRVDGPRLVGIENDKICGTAGVKAAFVDAQDF